MVGNNKFGCHLCFFGSDNCWFAISFPLLALGVATVGLCFSFGIGNKKVFMKTVSAEKFQINRERKIFKFYHKIYLQVITAANTVIYLIHSSFNKIQNQD